MTAEISVSGDIVINPRAKKRLVDGHLWVYKSDLEGPGKTKQAPPAGLVRVLGPKNKPMGLALYSPASTIALRFFSHANEVESAAALVLARLERAWQQRQRQLPGADAFRWVHGEADLLPGVFIDRFGECITLQTTCAGAEALEPWLLEGILSIAKPRAVVLRNDAASRRKEGLEQFIRLVHGEEPVLAAYHEGEIIFEVDLLAGQKTGGFLDQSTNHVLAGRYAFGEGLDCCTYHGGFALQLAKSCTKVLACDTSTAALEQAQKNTERAGLENIRFMRNDMFNLLPQLVNDGRHFDTIVLDPPAFASTSQTEQRALSAYKDINAWAMQLLRPGGILISCSCSGRIRPDKFDDMLDLAARSTRRRVQILERLGAGVDHPVLLGMPETEYLKCRIMTVM